MFDITDKRIAILDIETPWITETGTSGINQVYCIAVRIIDRGVISPATQVFTEYYLNGSSGSNQKAIELINSCTHMVFHNGVNFDRPVIEQVYKQLTPEPIDTLLIAKLMYTSDELMAIDYGIPDMDKSLIGKYSLRAFGVRLRCDKLHFDEFDKGLTSDMITYVKQDVEVTLVLFMFLIEKAYYPLETVAKLEHTVAEHCQIQEEAGFPFDYVKARKLNIEMMKEKFELERKLAKTFKPRFLPDGKPQKTNKQLKVKIWRTNPLYVPPAALAPHILEVGRYLKNGSWRPPGKTALKFFLEPHRLTFQWKDGEFQNIVYTKFEATDNQIKIWLKAMYNFEFSTYTAKGNVKVDRDDLEALGEYGQDLRRLLKLKKDISQLGGTENSLIAKYRADTGAIHGRIDTIGAATHRCTHSGPNLAQIPQGEYFRELFISKPGWVLVGADLANIEVRVLAHYLANHGNTDYAKAVLSKDMHWYHAKLAGFWTADDRDWPDDDHEDERTPEMKEARKASKGFFFGYLYGQGDTIRGVTLWVDGCMKREDYTDKEYEAAKKRIEKRLNSEGLFPLKKDMFVKPTELLILQTVYGKKVADAFLKNLTGIDELIKDCQRQSKEKGTVTAIDGRELYSRSPHSALNLLLQGSAGVIGKQWMVNYHQLAKERGMKVLEHYFQAAYIHDEYQCPCDPNYSELLSSCLEDGAAMVTEQFKMNLPIKADAVTGNSWADTH